jgi:hypothetical protein
LHRFETVKEFEKWCQDHANDDPPVELSPSEDVQQGLDFLAHAAEGRNWPAAHNLSVYYCTNSLTHDPVKWKYYLELSDSIRAEWNDKPKDEIV